MTNAQITFSPKSSPALSITVEIHKATAAEITGVRLPVATFGHGLKTWQRDEIDVAA